MRGAYFGTPWVHKKSRPAGDVTHYRIVYDDASVSGAFRQRFDARYDMEVAAVSKNPHRRRPIGLLRVLPKRASL